MSVNKPKSMSFTSRETDIISCLLNGRSVKRTAALLGISPKTVESHIRNVGLKFGLNTQESIIAFFENSDIYTPLKNHYLRLLPGHGGEANSGSCETNTLSIERNDSAWQPPQAQIKKHKKYIISAIVFCILSLGVGLALHQSTGVSDNVSWNIPRKDHKFIGRETLLKELHHKVSLPNAQVTVCAGLGGIGKTQLALNYVHAYKNSYSLRAWFAAENIDQLQQQYIDFAKTIGYQANEPAFVDAKLFIFKWLKDNPGWLLIYDNVESYEEIQSFLPDDGGKVILTTRQQIWPNTFNKLDIELMTEEESLDLIDSFIHFRDIRADDANIKQLVKTLGYLPLALSQAGAYLQYNNLSPEQYLDSYKTHKEYIINNTTIPEGTSSLPLATIWDITLDALNANAKELLKVCAYLAPDKIPQAVLLDWLKKSHPELSDPNSNLQSSLGELRRYSMIAFDEDGNVIIHRLVQDVLRAKNTSLNQRWFANIITALHQQFNNKTDLLEDEKRHRDLLPHLQMLLKTYKTTWPDADEDIIAPIINDIGMVFFQSHDYEQAQLYYERALKALQNKYPQGHLELAITKDLLGNAYRNLGLEVEAKELHTQALAYLQKHHGKHRDRLADVMDHLGRAQRMQGDCFASKKLHAQSLAIKEELYGKDHIEVALQLDQLGRDMRNLLEPRQAKNLLERSLKIKKKYYGQNHLEVAITLDYLGRCYRYIGDVKKAKELHEQSITIKEGIFGPDHIAVAYTLNQLGRDLRYLGDLEQAKALHMRSVKILSAHYGSDHVEVAYSIDYLARVYRVMGNVTTAKEMHEKVLELKNKHHGKDSLASGYSAEQLARDYRELGKHAKALELHQYALDLISKNKYKNNLTMAILYEQMGLDYQTSGNFLKALELHNQTLQMKLQYYGEDHPEIAKTYTYIGAALIESGDILKGKEYLQKSLKIKESFYGRNNIYLIDTLLGLGKAHRLLDNNYLAKKYTKKAENIKQQHINR